MDLADITTASATKMPDGELLNMHRRCHMLAVGSACEKAAAAHEILQAEMKRRGMQHASPLDCGKVKEAWKRLSLEQQAEVLAMFISDDDKQSRPFAGVPIESEVITAGITSEGIAADTKPDAKPIPGLYLAPPFGRLIRDGQMTTIAQPKRRDLTGPRVLVSGKLAYGIITLGTPAEVTTAEFDNRYEQHRVSATYRKRKWPDVKILWLYPIEHFVAFAEPRNVKVPAGVQTAMPKVEDASGSILTNTTVAEMTTAGTLAGSALEGQTATGMEAQVKGGPGSGNWMHAGDPPNVGGSSPGGGLSVIGSSRATSMDDRRSRSAELRDKLGKTRFVEKGKVSDKTKRTMAAALTEIPQWMRQNVQAVVLHEDDSYSFEAGGQDFMAGASWSVKDGIINIFDADKDFDVSGSMAHLSHEVGHAAFDEVGQMLHGESERLMSMPVTEFDRYFRMDGFPKQGMEDATKREFPYHVAYNEFHRAHSEGNGVTPYSKAWDRETETFAELAYIRYAMPDDNQFIGYAKGHGYETLGRAYIGLTDLLQQRHGD